MRIWYQSGHGIKRENLLAWAGNLIKFIFPLIPQYSEPQGPTVLEVSIPTVL
jgi:hypothetical protein